MQKISSATTTANPDGEFTEGSASAGVPSTLIKAPWLNSIQRELIAVLTAAGIAPSADKDDQVITALRALSRQGASAYAPDTGAANAYVCAFSPSITSDSRAEGQVLRFKVKTTNTGASTFNDGGGVLPLVGGAHSDLQGGELVAGGDAWVQLNGSVGTGSYVLLFCTSGSLQVATATKSQHAVPLSQAPSIKSSISNLKASATGTNASVSISADEVVVESTGNLFQTLRNVNLTINSAGQGANGLDTGALATATWYSLWVIWNGTTTAGLLSLSTTTPTLPNGYTHKARVGWVRIDGTANKYPLSFIQIGRSVQFKPAAGSNLASPPVIANGTAGTISTPPTWVAVGVSGVCPPTAKSIKLYGANTTAAAGTLIAAPNASYSGTASGTPPPLVVSNVGSSPCTGYVEMLLESANIYWASGAANQSLICLGWEDNF